MRSFAEHLHEYGPRVTFALVPALGFLLPLSGALGTGLAIAAVVMVLLQNRFRSALTETLKNRVVSASLAFFLLHVVGLLWTEDLAWGWHMVNKQWRLLLLPFLMVPASRERLQITLNAFILGMAAAHLFIYGSLLGFPRLEIINHISYNPLLALAIYLTACSLCFGGLSAGKRRLFWVILVSMSVNMFLTAGRAGHVAFFVGLLLIVFQVFPGRPLRAAAASLAAVFVVFGSFYLLSPVFQKRVDGAVNEVRNFRLNQVSVDGNDRITFALNTLEIFRTHPLLGVGTGDFPSVYREVNRLRTPDVFETDNPHNNYLLVLAQFGSIGLVVFLSIFYFQLRCARRTRDPYLRSLRLGLPVLYLAIMLFDSYLLGHLTALTFVYCTACCYRDCHED